jgi:hypothetical protein
VIIIFIVLSHRLSSFRRALLLQGQLGTRVVQGDAADEPESRDGYDGQPEEDPI